MHIVQVEPIGIHSNKQNELKESFREKGHNLVFYNTKPESSEETIRRIKNADVIILSNMPLEEKVLSACNKLQMISVAFAGVDHIDMDYCRKNQIIVSNAADYSTHSVAELTIGLIVSLYRKLKWSENQLRNGKDREGFLGNEVYGKTLGIVGLGRIGQQVAEIGKALGCNILAYNRSEKNIAGVHQVKLEELLKNSDIISLHIPLTNETKGIIGKDQINLIKDTAILVNTARGPVVDYFSLTEALKNNQIAGAAIDVYEKEPPIEKSHPLMEGPNVILQPHIGFATQEAIKKRGEIVINNIWSWMNGKPENIVK
jgi:D-3-phosphoglycerate dehydrogenase